MDQFSSPFSIGNISAMLIVLIQLTVLGFLIYFVIRTKCKGGILLGISIIMSLLSAYFQSYVYIHFIDYETTNMEIAFEKANNAVMVYSLIYVALFAGGIIMIIRKFLRINS